MGQGFRRQQKRSDRCFAMERPPAALEAVLPVFVLLAPAVSVSEPRALIDTNEVVRHGVSAHIL